MGLYVTGDTHGEEGRFRYMDSEILRTLKNERRHAKKNTHSYKLILTSKGLNTIMGEKIISKVMEKEHISFEDKKIFLLTFPEYEVDDRIINACINLGFMEENIYKTSDYEGIPVNEMPDVDVLFCTEGNVFEIISYLRLQKFDVYAKKIMAKEGSLYIGSSAGACIAGGDVRIAEPFDHNFMHVTNYEGLELTPGEDDGKSDTIISHYTFKECKNYLSELSPQERAEYGEVYNEILNVANEEALVMDITKTYGKRDLTRKKRIRLEVG